MGIGRKLTLVAALAIIAMPTNALYADDDELDLGGEIRTRTEYKSPFNYVDADGGNPTGDDGTSMRTRIHLNWMPSESIAVFLQAQDSRVWGVESVSDTADPDLDMRQAYVSLLDLQSQEGFSWLGDNAIDVHLGRILVPTFGDGYILSDNDWQIDGPYAFDGVWIDGSFGSDDFGVEADFLYMDIDDNDPYAPGAEAGGPADDTVFWGVNLATEDFSWVGAEFYFWNIDRPKSDDETIYGWRLTSDLSEHGFEGLSLVFEYALAGGERSGNDVDANFWVLRGEYEFDFLDLPHSFGIGYSHASGSPGSASDDETWMSPFAETHQHLGHYDLVANSNVNDFFITFEADPTEEVTVNLDFHFLSLDEEDGGWSTVTTGTEGSGGAITDDDLGTEIDLYLSYNWSESTLVSFGWSRFSAGDAVSDATGGFDDSGDFFYLQAELEF